AAQMAAQQAADALGDAGLVAILHEQVGRRLLQEFAQALGVLHDRQLQPARVEREAEVRLTVAQPGLEHTRRVGDVGRRRAAVIDTQQRYAPRREPRREPE